MVIIWPMKITFLVVRNEAILCTLICVLLRRRFKIFTSIKFTKGKTDLNVCFQWLSII